MLPASSKKAAIYGSALLSAAMLLPAVNIARADAPPEHAVVAMRFLNYRDRQSGDTEITRGMTRDRITVNALTVDAKVPLAGSWLIGTTFVEDSVTGASPAYHSGGFPKALAGPDAVSGASGELRHAGDLSVTRYFAKGSLSGGLSYSRESDYISRGYSLQGSISTEDKNTTFTIGAGFNDDTIDLNRPAVVASKRQVPDEKKHVFTALFGLTRVCTKDDIVQLNFGYTNGNGYYSDPYKDPDKRPGLRNVSTVMTRWNHYFRSTEGTTRLSYRYYSDTFGIRAHTLDAEYVQPLHRGWTVTPLFRLYSQNEADFYVASNTASPADPVPVPPGTPCYSEDQRLSSFGALTLGMKVGRELGRNWHAEAEYEHYQQRGSWSINGHGDPGVATFMARFVQLGVSREF